MSNLIQQQQIHGLQATIAGLPTDSRLIATGTTLQQALYATGTTLSGSLVDLDERLDITGYQLQGDLSTFSGRLETTGTTLVTSINSVATDLLYTGTKVIEISGNLQEAIRNTGLDILVDLSTRSGNLQANIIANTNLIDVVSGATVKATGQAEYNRNLITGANTRTFANDVFIADVSGITVDNEEFSTMLSGGVTGMDDILSTRIIASGQQISGTLNLKLEATGASLSGLASETRLYQTGTVSNRLGINNTDPGRAATLGYTNYAATSYGETMINAGATAIQATRILQWGGDVGPYKTGELFLARSAGERAYIPWDRTWFVKMYGTMKQVDERAIRKYLVYNLAGYETGFVVDSEFANYSTAIRVSMGGTVEEDPGRPYVPLQSSSSSLSSSSSSCSGPLSCTTMLQSGVIIHPFSTGQTETVYPLSSDMHVMGISGVNPTAGTIRFRVTAIVTESDNTALI